MVVGSLNRKTLSPTTFLRWTEAVGITERDRVVPRIRIQVDPAREPDGILGEEAPFGG